MIDLKELPDIIKIEVLSFDIDNGAASNCEYCPVALATGRALLPVGSLVVRTEYVRFVIVDSNGFAVVTVIYNLPSSAQQFIYQFDAHHAVKPFEFELERSTIIDSQGLRRQVTKQEALTLISKAN